MSASTITAGNEDLLLARSQSVPDNLSVSYKAEGGLHVVSGHGCILTDADGHRYLDAVNNVAHVGHSNPHVHQALATQHAKLNTNTRYLNPQLATYTRRLLDLCPPPLSHGRCFLVASGSEANDLAMRLCRAHVDAKRKKEMEGTNSHEPADSEWKQKQVFVCLSYGYHGATDSVVDISPYKYRSKGGHGQPANVIEIGVPSAMDDEQQIRRELDILQQQVDAAVASGKDICGFFAESVLSCAGQVFLPPSFLQRIYTIIRNAGGCCVADEVQTGFGRLGAMWAFQTQGVVPDIVTMGKPIGNGYPLAAVVCTSPVASAFANGMEYFNSCAGTNVATAVGMAVLDCIRDQDLVNHAARVGSFLMSELRRLQAHHDHPIIHDVRGQGLMIGIEIRTEGVRPAQLPLPLSTSSSHRPVHVASIKLRRSPRQPLPSCPYAHASSNQPTQSTSMPTASVTAATPPSPCLLSCGDVCAWLCSALMLCHPMGVLVGTDGPKHNVIKIKPPMVFNATDAAYAVSCLDACLRGLYRCHPCLAGRRQISSAESAHAPESESASASASVLPPTSSLPVSSSAGSVSSPHPAARLDTTDTDTDTHTIAQSKL